MYRETISIWTLLDCEDPQDRRSVLASLSNLGCPRGGSCRDNDSNCIICWGRALERVEEVIIRCDV